MRAMSVFVVVGAACVGVPGVALADRTEIGFDPGVSLYSQYVLRIRDDAGDTSWFHDFELTRGHVFLGIRYDHAFARVLVEGVRSASEGALLGVAGNSFVFRVREAYAGYWLFGHLELRAGLLPTLTIPTVERAWSFRALNASAIERVGFGSPSDLGVTMVGHLPKDFGWVGVGAYNGEGYARPELNRGKNVEIAAEVHPLAFVPAAKPLAVFGSYQSGSSGTGLSRADRVHAGIAWLGDVVRGGAAFSYALGVDDDGGKSAVAVDVFARATLWTRLLLGADFTYWMRDTAREGDDALLFTGAAGVQVAKPLSALVAFDGQFFGDAARASLPDEDDYRLRVIVAFDFDHWFQLSLPR
ncbi:MAG: hypothetical protein U0414_02590 [Polyangiaceae bacterium]